MRLLLLACVLAAAPASAAAKDGAGRCLWQTMPQLVRDEAVLTYGREGRAAFLEAMGRLAERLDKAALDTCVGPDVAETDIKPIAEAFNAYGLEAAATETLARRAGRTVATVQGLWGALTAEQREQFRKIADGGELEMDAVQTINQAGRMIGIAPETKTRGDQRFEDILGLFYATASRELAETKF